MRLLFLSQRAPFPVYGDGATLRVYFLLKEFSKRCEVFFLPFERTTLSTPQREEIDLYADTLSEPWRGEVTPRSAIGKGFSYHRFTSMDFRDSIRNVVRRWRPSHVFTEQTFMAQYWDAFADIPRVISAVDAISLAAFRQARSYRSTLQRAAMRLVGMQRLIFEYRYFRRFCRCTVVAEDDARFLRNTLGLDVSVIPNGVDLDWFTPTRLGRDRRGVTFSGNLAAPMNSEAARYLCEQVFPHLAHLRPELRFVVAGRSPSDELQGMASGRVAIQADVGEMLDVYADTAIYVSPIEHGTGIKNSVLQAMAMGLPVVVSPLVAEGIGIQDGVTGRVVERKGLVQAVDALAGDVQLQQRLGAAARRFVESRYSWSAVAAEYLDLLSTARRCGKVD